MFKNLFAFILFISLSLAQVELNLGYYEHATNSVKLYVSSSEDIYGFEFIVSSSSLSLAGISG